MSLLPIHPESQIARDIARLEEAMRRIRTVVSDAGVADRFMAKDPYVSSSFDKLMLANEGQWDWQGFYNRWGCSWRMEGRSCRPKTFPMHQAGPQWVKFSTEDRLAWGRLLPAIVDALAGHDVSISLCNSWRWDNFNRRPNGQPRFVKVFEAMIVSRSGKPFVPGDLGKTMVANHCMVEHPICGEELFAWRDDLGSDCNFTSYQWTSTGFIVSIWGKQNQKAACEALFGGLTYTLVREGKADETCWTVSVDLTNSSPEALKSLAKTVRPVHEETCAA